MKRKIDAIFADFNPGNALKIVSKLEPKRIIEIIKESGLRGRGGAGFPTGLKWEAAFKESSSNKYIICNADEGEPGTFKDKMILEKKAAKVIEGMTIAAYSIGAKKGFIYLRGEYEYLKPMISSAILKMKENNLLGNNICGKSNFNFDIDVRLGSGAYVCGEETSLLESLESKRGEPRNKPPYPVTHGFLGEPTIINNVETLTFIPHIIEKGASWFKKLGTEYSKGSKLFSVSGDCAKPGIYEFEFGITVKELLKEVSAKDTKAVQVGGASGFCIIESEFDNEISFEGTPTGGAIIIFDNSRNMFEVLKNFSEFFDSESCGQCTPCREGCARILESLIEIENGGRASTILENLTILANAMKLSSKCGFGQSVPNSLTTIINKFKDEIIGAVDGKTYNR